MSGGLGESESKRKWRKFALWSIWRAGGVSTKGGGLHKREEQEGARCGREARQSLPALPRSLLTVWKAVGSRKGFKKGSDRLGLRCGKIA